MSVGTDTLARPMTESQRAAALRRTEVLLEVTRKCATMTQIDGVLAMLVELTSRELDCDRGTLFLNDPKTGELYSRFAQGSQSLEIRILNNSGIAAERLRAAGLRPAILDVDVHHGNGTQGMFYERDDVLTVSIHADPARFYPFFWGHAQERGAGRGLGCNLNLPLPRGTNDDGFLEALTTALQRVRNFGTEALVVALGLDASIDDPFQGLAVTQDGFARIGAAIAATGLPVLFVQEGGYLSDTLGANLTRTLTGFQEAS